MIRQITQEDKQAYLQLTGEFYGSDAVLHNIPQEYRENTFQELMRSDEYVKAYLLEEEGKTAGYVLLARTFTQEVGGFALWIDELYIRPEFQGKGLGKSVFRFLEEQLDEKVCRLRLETEPENERARELYRRMGFSPLPYLQMIKDS